MYGARVAFIRFAQKHCATVISRRTADKREEPSPRVTARKSVITRWQGPRTLTPRVGATFETVL
jgi:hypothetical protein